MASVLQYRDNRKNHVMRSVVNFGSVLARESVENAASYMQEHGVPLHIAHRILVGNPKPMKWSQS